MTGRNRIPICHVQVLPLLTGVQRAMLEIFRFLDRGRYQPHVVCRDEGPLTEELERLGIPCFLLPALDRPIHPVQDWRAYRALERLFREQRFEIVHTHSSKPGVVARVAARRAGVPHVIHHVQGFAFHEFSPPHKRWLYSRLEKWAGRFCDRVIFVNDEERRLAIENRWLPAEKCLTIYNGADLEAFDGRRCEDVRTAFRVEHGLDDDEVAILMLGRLDEQKQPLILPEIAARLDALRPSAKWRLIVAGSGPFEAKLAERIQSLNIGHRLQMLGWQRDPRRVLQAGDIVLHPSLWEGLPLSLIEAHAAGLPAVASDVKGNREVVSPQTGFLCRPKDPDDYARALAALIDAPSGQAGSLPHEGASLRTEFGKAARKRAERHFNSAANARQVIALYEELMGLNREHPPARRAA